MQKNILWIVGIIIVAGAFLLWNSNKSETTPTASDTNAPAAQEQTTPSEQSIESEGGTGATTDINVSVNAGTLAVITYNGTSFSPATLTIKKGDSVTWNSAAGNVWVASAPHPAHTAYDGTARSEHCASGYAGPAPFDQCVSGSSYTFTFNKAGTWKYHDHQNLGAFGTIIVQ